MDPKDGKDNGSPSNLSEYQGTQQRNTSRKSVSWSRGGKIGRDIALSWLPTHLLPALARELYLVGELGKLTVQMHVGDRLGYEFERFSQATESSQIIGILG